MRPTLEALERSMLKQGALLVERAIKESEGPTTVALVERVVRSCTRTGGDHVKFLFGSQQWKSFRVLYPVAAGRLEKEARR